MQSIDFLTAIALWTIISTCHAASKSSASVLLANVKTLTLRNGYKTTARRVSAIPQLKCVGGNAKDLYQVDVMRCKNQGADYDEHNIQWTCTASLPVDFKLGSTDVICEGYESPEDPFILKGSCGVEYRLFLTTEGEAKYGHRSGNDWHDFQKGAATKLSNLFFWVLFVAIAGFIVYSALQGQRPGPRQGGPWGGWGGGGNDDPPPPYDWQPPRKPKSTTTRSTANTDSRTSRNRNANPQQGWRPGFWTGALGGAGLGYLAGNRGRAPQQETQPRTRGWGAGSWGSNTAERDSGTAGSPPSGTPSASTSRYESQGFGSTTRR